MERITTTFFKRRVDSSFSSRAIVNGGSVTLFPRKVPGFGQTCYQPAIRPTLMDYAYLDRLHCLERDADKYQLRINNSRSIELFSPLVKISLEQPHYHLSITGFDFTTPIPEIPQRTFHRLPPHSDDIGASNSDAPLPPYSATHPFDFQEMMSMLQRMEYGITANSIAIQSISQRVDTFATDQHLAMFSMYDNYSKIHRIAETDPHPSWSLETRVTASRDLVVGVA